MLSEPLSLLILLAALVIAVFAPAFHYHQFGEVTRMARDAGFSALLICGGAVAVFGTIRTFRREIESRTCEMALAHPVSRQSFFLMKGIGAFVAYLIFAAIVFCVSVTIVEGAAVGGQIAKAKGDLARLWGPCFMAGICVMVLPLVVGAALNALPDAVSCCRSSRCRPRWRWPPDSGRPAGTFRWSSACFPSPC